MRFYNHLFCNRLFCKNISRLCASSLLLFGTGYSFAQAENLSYQDEWHFRIAPYIWAASIDGDLGHRHVGTHHVKSSFSDIVSNVDLSAMIMGEARKGPYSLLFDFMYIDSSIKHGLPPQVPAKEIKASGKVITGFAGVGYTFWENPQARLDVVGGLRTWHTDVDLTLNGGPFNGRSAGVNKSWVDVKVGLRGYYKFNDQFSITSWGLVGKGGAKSDWDAALLLNWLITKDFTVAAGYRALSVDYRKDRTVYDVTQKGPMIGISYHF
ncbi:MAG TPA: DUF481 domain-containing protein [Candidatus Ignatzschineria merdigallinarum]|uniref:DUF481 domain-containing protein n=1 Tax=Candidatus Ignatzschineria merdigallinarum TaxID=2838621 RepID=A0A9D1TV76_9GAMM|nr:DUF481 domain-containing protein [Candidatus Ignatzschineria merdigallinarum]